MKKLLCTMMTCSMLLMTAAALADNAGYQIIPAETVPSEPESFSNVRLANKACGDYYVATVIWDAGGESFEWVNGGLRQPMTLQQATTGIRCFQSGIAFTLEGYGLVDAEKASNKLPTAGGEPLAGKDEIRAQGDWGDSQQCWAGSLSDMLQVTGWGKKAGFTNEDDLFSFFTGSFTNAGNYQLDAAAWFFYGQYERDVGMAEVREQGSGGLLPDAQFPVSKLTGSESVTDYADQIGKMFLQISEGACIGLDVQMFETVYPLKDDEVQTAMLDYETGTYKWSEVIFCEPDETLYEKTFILDDSGEPVLVTDAGNGSYADEDGKLYPSGAVMVGKFALNSGVFYLTSTEANSDERTYMITRTISTDDLRMDAPEESAVGAHALTAIGYIRCISESGVDLRALIIIDSDNSAHCYSPVSDQVLKQDRPNIYTMYFTERSSLNRYETQALSNYIGRTGEISGVTLMTLAPNEPEPTDPPADAVPQTGDTMTPALWAAGAAVSGLALTGLVLAGRKRHER